MPKEVYIVTAPHWNDWIDSVWIEEESANETARFRSEEYGGLCEVRNYLLQDAEDA